jgi:hypothetical protein
MTARGEKDASDLNGAAIGTARASVVRA